MHLQLMHKTGTCLSKPHVYKWLITVECVRHQTVLIMCRILKQLLSCPILRSNFIRRKLFHVNIFVDF